MRFLLGEFLGEKSVTVIAIDEQEQAILELLRSKKLIEAIALLKNIKSSDRLVELAREALEIAKSLRNTDAIKQLAKLPFSKRDKSDFFIFTIRALLEFNEDAAVSLVLYNKFTEEDVDIGWRLLASHFKNQGDLQWLEIVYDHLSCQHEKAEIAQRFLRTEVIEQNWQSYLLWFGRYYGLSYPHGDSQYCRKAIEILNADVPVDVIVKAVNLSFNDASKQHFLEKLYMEWLKTQSFVRCQQLEKALPAELAWLTLVREAVTTGNNFEVFSKVSFEYKGDLISLALSQAITNIVNDEAVTPALIDRAAAVPDRQRCMLELGCKQCIDFGRYDAAISMLAHLEQSQAQNCINLLALRGGLSEAQQSRVLEKTTFDTYNWPKIQQAFLAPLVEMEQRRRTEEMFRRVRKEYLSLKNVGAKHKKYSGICSALTDLIVSRIYDQALALCAVLAPSCQRDKYVDDILAAILARDPVNFGLVIKVCQLYQDKAAAENWKKFFTILPLANDQEILKASVKCPYKSFARGLIVPVAVRILSGSEPDASVEFLRSSGFLASHWCNGDVSVKVVVCLVQIHENDLSKLVRRVKSWIKNNIGGYDVLVMQHLLEKNELRHAIILLNALIKASGHDLVTDESCFNLVSSHLRECTPKKELFGSVALLEEKSARQRLIAEVCYAACQLDDESSLVVVRSCPDAETKSDYLICLLVSWLRSTRFELADRALNSLRVEAQQYWRPIVQYFKANQFDLVLKYWFDKGTFCNGLTQTVMTNWLKDLPSDQILVQFSSIYKIRQGFARCVPLSDDASLDRSMERHNAKTECDRILGSISTRWRCVFVDQAKPDISEIIAGIRIILPWSKESQEVGFLEAVNNKIIENLTAENSMDLLSYVRVLLEQQVLVYQHFTLSEAALIKLGAFRELERLIIFANANGERFTHWATYARERLTTEYLNRRMFAEVISLLPDDMSMAERRAVMSCVERHLNANDLQRVNGLLEKLTVRIHEQEALPLVSYLLKANYVLEAKTLFCRYVKTPTQVLPLAKRVTECYWKKLALMLNPEGETTVKFICSANDKITMIKQCLASGDSQEAIRLQTEIVQDMRRLPDIAFKAYCEGSFPAANINFLYFPMIPSTERGGPADGLELLLRKYKLPQFRAQQAAMFAFLLSIQPAVSREHLWLETLFPMNNAIKHEGNIDLNEVSVPFLTDVLNGVTLILLKLHNPNLLVPDLEKYLPKAFVDLDQLSPDLPNLNPAN